MNEELKTKVKKILYKNNPPAKLCYISKNGIVYCAEHEDMAIMFVIPFDLEELGDVKLSPTEDSKLLIRYINTVNQITDN